MILSQIMIAELLYIHHKPIQLNGTRFLHQTTLKALLRRKLIRREGDQITTTQLGDEIATQRELNMRKHEADISDSVKALLHVSKILSFKRKIA